MANLSNPSPKKFPVLMVAVPIGLAGIGGIFLLAIYSMIANPGPTSAPPPAATRDHAAATARSAAEDGVLRPAPQEAPHPKYTIVGDAPINNGSVRDVTVRIDGPIPEEGVRAIANKIKESSPKNYQTTSIFFLLPEQASGQAAWARALFKPSLTVTIIGATVEQTKKAVKAARPVDGEKIGEWKWELPGTVMVIVIAKRGDSFFQTVFSGDGTKGDEEELSPIGPNQFQKKRGEKVVINAEGNLDMYGESGRLAERAARIK